jgi:ferric-dicitrate binding protein FerR (iron transport regulator)
MTDPEDEILSPAEQRARAALAALPHPAVDVEFRARLRESFVSGEAPPLRARVPRLPWHSRPMTHWTLGVAAVAAALLAVLTMNQGGDWQVISAHGSARIMVDGRAVPGGDVAVLERRLRIGTRLELPEGSDLMLRAGDQWLMAVDAGTSLTLPAIPGRWFAREVSGDVDAGEIRLSTSRAFHGAALALSTPEATVRVTGTTFAVICESTGTCVCVLEGSVRMGAGQALPAEVPAGMRGYAFADRRPMMRATMRVEEEPKLGTLRELGRVLFESRSR